MQFLGLATTDRIPLTAWQYVSDAQVALYFSKNKVTLGGTRLELKLPKLVIVDCSRVGGTQHIFHPGVVPKKQYL